jgi:hypothetical protein
MKQIEAKVLVADEMARSLPARPDRVRECMNAAEQAMNETAAVDGLQIAHAPKFSDSRATGLGFVELTFVADTVKR